MTQRIIPCMSCRHFRQGQPGAFCDAFPDGDGIPVEVIMGRRTHRTPLPGDHGIQWEPKPGQDRVFDGVDVEREPFPLSALGN